ncbi:MAG: MarR family winged helix-turn-helix transcriptional regulator [Olegusella sp.]|nr:MarR family winged helix-turn-helix transcriptional regulator [Olegusella sp.]
MGAKTSSEETARKLLVYSRALPKGLIGSRKGAAESESAVLFYLCNKDEKDEVIPSEIAAEFGYPRARVTRILDALESRGEVKRVHDKQDRRRVLVYATEKGRAASRESDAKATEGLVKFIDSLGEEDADELVRILRKGYQNTFTSHSPSDLDV